MYFPVGWPKQLKCQQDDGSLVRLMCNRERIFVAVITENSISIWFAKPAVQLVCVRRSQEDAGEFGVNEHVEWKPDSLALAITTSKGYIIFYKIEMKYENANCAAYVQKGDSPKSFGNDLSAAFSHEPIPAIKLKQYCQCHVPGGVTSIICLRDVLLVATRRGCLQRIHWDGMLKADMTIDVSDIPFSTDLQHSRSSQLNENSVYCSQIQYSPLIGGFAAVLSNGFAAFITAHTLKFEPGQIVGVLAQDVSSATHVAVNHKYTLMAFGCSTSEAVVYTIDELTGALQVSHKLVISSKDIPDVSRMCGSVRDMKWSPDGCAIVLCWEKGGWSLWSVFGALLRCSVGTRPGMSDDVFGSPVVKINSLEWTSEGYNLWAISQKTCEEDNVTAHSNGGTDTESSFDMLSDYNSQLLQIQFIKSALSVNPCMSNYGHLFLQGEDRLYLSTENPFASQPNTETSEINFHLLGSKQWQIVPIPQSYLAHNWPIRYTAVNSEGYSVAVAGKTGFAHYTLFTRKWKLFGNESQERDMVVSGGLCWWKDFICVACYNLVNQCDEIRCYPRESKLDNTFCQTTRVVSQILLLNTFRDILIVLCADCHIVLYKIQSNPAKTNATITLSKIQELAIGTFISHPATVISVNLTPFRTETAPLKISKSNSEVESILVNVAGKLLMFQRDRSGPQVVPAKENKERPLPFCAPVVVASCVENTWSSSQHSREKPHLTEALWLGCGASGMKVWLPLHPNDHGKTRGFLSRRIMLPFKVDIYPLAVLFEGGIILGSSCETVAYHSSCGLTEGWPYLHLECSSHIFLHHLLRQLLRRNLGVYALDVARSCSDLSFFAHVLELLLHEVLEEEATSKDPIPDPLLPRVVAFVEEFPQYLETVVHCARKTEVALWSYLFSTVGSPKDLFEECLVSGRLNTAASYLIILQNLEKPIVSRQHATLLLDSALENCQWQLVRDIVRFLKAIDPTEADQEQNRSKVSNTTVYPQSFSTPPISPSDSAPFMYTNSLRGRTLSMTKEELPERGIRELRSTPVRPLKSENSRTQLFTSSPKEEPSAEQFFIDSILQRHARKLICAYRLYDLAEFSANMDGYELVAWLRKERFRAAHIDDFLVALKRIHLDFKWPFPIVSLKTLRKISSNERLISKSSSLSPLTLSIPESKEDQPDASEKQNVDVSPALLHKLSLATSDSTSDTTFSTAEVILQSQMLITTNGASQTTTEKSDDAWIAGDLENSDINNTWNDQQTLSELEQFSAELANKGPPQSDIQLRYLLQMLLEAGCLEWSLLIGVVLQDVQAVVRTVNTASLTETPIDVVARMREGLSFLQLWADTECFGYKPFFQMISPHRSVLDKIVAQDPATSRISVKRLSSSSTESLSQQQQQRDRSQTDLLSEQLVRSGHESQSPPPAPSPNIESVNEDSSQGCFIS